ncbi:MAG: hypothetical protein ACT4P6_15050 [Gemmatimonadaceae bacterium]
MRKARPEHEAKDARWVHKFHNRRSNQSILTCFCQWDQGLSARSDGLIDTTSLGDFQKWVLERGELDAIVPAATFWDSGFIDQANVLLNRTR